MLAMKACSTHGHSCDRVFAVHTLSNKREFKQELGDRQDLVFKDEKLWICFGKGAGIQPCMNSSFQKTVEEITIKTDLCRETDQSG